MTVISMFAGNDENQWLDQVEEEFGSDLLEIDDKKATGAKATIKIGINAKAALKKEMKEKDYDIEGVDLQFSKPTHQTNMTGKTGCTLTRSVTTKKFAMNFKQQKTILMQKGKRTLSWSSASVGCRLPWLLDTFASPHQLSNLLIQR
jgi:hypothetical protein